MNCICIFMDTLIALQYKTDIDYINLRNSVLIISLQNEKVTMK